MFSQAHTEVELLSDIFFLFLAQLLSVSDRLSSDRLSSDVYKLYAVLSWLILMLNRKEKFYSFVAIIKHSFTWYMYIVAANVTASKGCPFVTQKNCCESNFESIMIINRIYMYDHQ